jgi:BolA protein
LAKETKLKRSEKIRLILDQALSPLELEVIDDSSLHAGHSGARDGGETHYRVEVVSAEFVDKSRVARERLIHALLADEFSDGLHALSIKARAPNEPH